MDMENDALRNWDNTDTVTGIGKKRLDNKNWIAHIRNYIDYGIKLGVVNYDEDKAKDMAVEEYIIWVKNGGGDEWFEEED